MLCRPEIAADGKRFAQLNRERAELTELVDKYARYKQLEARIAEDKAALSDPELRELAAEELPELEAEIAEVEGEIQVLLLPKDPNDERNVFLEIRAGTGGEEAALF